MKTINILLYLEFNPNGQWLWLEKKLSLIQNIEVIIMSRKEHHVVYNNSEGGWDVKRDNAKRISGHYDTKREATDAARRFSTNANTELIIHNKNGRISQMDSHGNDPCPPKDKR